MTAVAADRTAVLVPALDAARTLHSVLTGIAQALPDAQQVVIDDGSTDGTGRVAREQGAHVICFERNRGKGAALRAGFEWTIANGLDAAITIDADGQHDPRCAPALLARLDCADIVIGTRERLGTPMPLQRRLSNALSSAAINRCAGTVLPDTQSGYRALSAAVLRRVHPAGDRYEFETDLIILAARAGFTITGVPIPTIYGAPSHFRPVHDTMRVIATIWRHRRSALHH